jgi:carbon starvation protein
MNIVPVLSFAAVFLLIAYRLYGNRVSKRLGLQYDRPTPAHIRSDGVDFVPTRPFVVLGHHFASIAGAGPIIGPVLAMQFGWIPALIWILAGGVFFGAIQDITALAASLRHEGKSIGEIIFRYIGPQGKRLFLIFAFATLILVIAVFTDIVAKTFVSVPAAASASLGFILLAMLFGWLTHRRGVPFNFAATIGAVIMFLLIPAGTFLPVALTYNTWVILLLIYVFFGAITPVWLLLQPRDFLNSFLLYGMMAAGLAGALIANPSINAPAAFNWHVKNLGTLFPVLFVTVACGAISGFHSLVASGTTSKQLDRETDAKVVGFGGMLIESFLAVLALTTVMILPSADYTTRLVSEGPVTLFSKGLGGFMAFAGLPEHHAVAFVALAVSAFAITSLDTCTRLARYVLHEYFETVPGRTAKTLSSNRYAATVVPVFLSLALLLTGGFSELWPIFGSANQLLGAVSLLAVTVWLARSGTFPVFTFVPMVFMFIVTLSSLGTFVWNNIQSSRFALAGFAVLLIVLAFSLLLMARTALRLLPQKS